MEAIRSTIVFNTNQDSPKKYLERCGKNVPSEQFFSKSIMIFAQNVDFSAIK